MNLLLTCVHPNMLSEWHFVYGGGEEGFQCSAFERNLLQMSSSALSLQFLDGAALLSVQGLNKPVRQSLEEETHILSLDKPRFIHGTGIAQSNGSKKS